MMSEKRQRARFKFLVNKVRHRCKYICCFAALTRNEQDYFATVVARLSTFALKHIADGFIVGKPDSIEMQLKDAAANEMIQRKVFGKKITPFHKRELRRYSKKEVRRHLKY